MNFFLGTHEPSWLGRLGMPLFISRRRLARQKSFPRAVGTWALDSGGFSELSLFGQWETKPEDYAREVRRYRDEIGGLQWAAIQDWMCEPFMLAKTGLTLAEHQGRTIDSFERLKDLAPDLPWLPVLQGWGPDDYVEHVELYLRRGIKLFESPCVGLGSVCRRQHTAEAEGIIRGLAGSGLRLHGFGFKVQGLARVQDVMESADSMAWSFQARRNPPLPECRRKHASCANCIRYAVLWVSSLESSMAALRWSAERQLTLELGEVAA